MSDWIKIEKILPDKMEVLQLASIIGIDEDAVVGKLFRFWVWVDSNMKTCNASGVTYSMIDRIANCAGFAEGLVKVGWLEGREGRLSIPNFDRHFGQTAKTRAVTNKRVKLHREAAKTQQEKCNDASVTCVTPQALPDKIREYINTTTTSSAQERAGGVEQVEPYPLSVEEVAAYMRGLPLCGLRGDDLLECASKYFLEMEECGWLTKRGLPVAKWRPGAEKYATAWRGNLSKQPPGGPSGRKTQTKQHKNLTEDDYEL